MERDVCVCNVTAAAAFADAAAAGAAAAAAVDAHFSLNHAYGIRMTTQRDGSAHQAAQTSELKAISAIGTGLSFSIMSK